MSERRVAAGTRMYFGAPSKPMPRALSDAIAAAVARVPGIVEAHLPQCLIEGDVAARQVLVLGALGRDDIPRIASALMTELVGVFPPGGYIDILPFDAAAVPEEVRAAGCRIYGQEPSSRQR